MIMFCLFCTDTIDKIYDSDDDVPLTQILLQNTIGISTKDKDTEDDEDDESYEDFFVMADDLDEGDN